VELHPQTETLTTHLPLPAYIQENIPLADKNWFRTGGPARWYSEPTTAEEFQQAVMWAHQEQLPIFILGEGANILISDEGYQGLVIRPQLKEITKLPHTNVPATAEPNTAYICAQAGVKIPDLIKYCLEHNLCGLEEFSGIPGTVGGSVFINIHYFQFFLSNFLVNAQVIDNQTGALETVSKEWFNFGYDYSKLHEQRHYLVSATFVLKQVDPITAAYAKGRSVEIIRHRVSRYPNKNTCGSFFRNFFPEEVTIESNGKKMIYVAYYLDKLGIKGELSVGGAAVSYQHANMLVTKDGATSTDVINLARTMQELVHKEFGITPQAECQFVGFAKYPLHK
jgi:UDP-N-acetylmuramate dehydrogenase